MIEDLSAFASSQEIAADVAVVGSGPAGVTAARRLAKSGLSVLVLESGKQTFDPAIQALNQVQCVGKLQRVYQEGSNFHQYLPLHYRGENRIRQFGGTSCAWTGKWRAFTPSDFQEYPWIAHSSWPIGMDDLQAHYAAVIADLGLGDLLHELATPKYQALLRELARHYLKAAIHYWQEQPLRVAQQFGAELKASSKIQVILGATTTELRLTENLQRIVGVRCRSLEGQELMVRAKYFLLAPGGLEAARLLLESNRQIPQGIGNTHDLVGRFYQDHLKVQDGRLTPGASLRKFAPDLQNQPRPRFGFSFSLSDATLEQFRLLRHSIYLKPKYKSSNSKRWFWLGPRREVSDQLGTIDYYRVKFASEQVPHRESRVYLDTARDRLGMRKLILDWRFTAQDHDSVAKSCQLLAKSFAAAKLGKLDFPADPMAIDAMMDSAHPMGTTRMAHTAREGVVDRDCRVFGVENLFIASSSVFPCGAVYSPTLTIVALAHRVAQHIVQEIHSSPKFHLHTHLRHQPQ